MELSLSPPFALRFWYNGALCVSCADRKTAAFHSRPRHTAERKRSPLSELVPLRSPPLHSCLLDHPLFVFVFIHSLSLVILSTVSFLISLIGSAQSEYCSADFYCFFIILICIFYSHLSWILFSTLPSLVFE